MIIAIERKVIKGFLKVVSVVVTTSNGKDIKAANDEEY